MENKQFKELSEKADQTLHALSLIVDVVKKMNASATRAVEVSEQLAVRVGLLAKIAIGVVVLQLVIGAVQLAIVVGL